MNTQFNPELELDHQERGLLTQVTTMPGYLIMHRIFRSEIDKFFVKLLNADPANGNEVVAAQLTAKAAAQFYEGVNKRINEEIVQYLGAPRYNAEPQDMTEGVLDLGDLEEAVQGYPNLFGETE